MIAPSELELMVREAMRRHTIRIVLTALALLGCQTGSAANGLCEPLRQFVASVKPGDTRVIEFRTSWGSDFKDSDSHDEFVISAKRCDRGNYDPANAVCNYLMEHAPVEFSDISLKDAVMCLSRKTSLGDMSIYGIEMSLTYGTHNRGSIVDIKYSPDEQLGGMVLSITARGY
jgi:hypothetical protein